MTLELTDTASRRPPRLAAAALIAAGIGLLAPTGQVQAAPDAAATTPERPADVEKAVHGRLSDDLTPECFVAARAVCEADGSDAPYETCLKDGLETVRRSGTLEHPGCFVRIDLDADGEEDLVVTVVGATCSPDSDDPEGWPDGCRRGVAVLWGAGGVAGDLAASVLSKRPIFALYPPTADPPRLDERSDLLGCWKVGRSGPKVPAW